MKNTVLLFIKETLKLDSVVLTKPKDPKFGHFATPVAFNIAKEQKRNPVEVAKELAGKLENIHMFESVACAGPYINFTLSSKFLDERITEALKNRDNFAKGNEEEKILLEFVSANPTGPLHIGHARGAIYGDALQRIGKRLGYDIVSEYYVNDAGNQIRLLGESVFYGAKKNILAEDVEIPEGCYKGDYIADVAKKAVDTFGHDFFSDKNNIEEISVWAKEKMLELIKASMKDNGIEFDSFVSEKTLYDKWDEVQKQLEEHNALYKDDEGKVWLKSSEKKDAKDRVVVRENGIPTYLAGDIIYHQNKYKRGFDRYINIWGADHHGYIDRVKASIEFLGNDSDKLEILLSQMVAILKGGVPYKMSKRAGNFILMDDVVEDIGIDALRFVFLTKKSDTHLEFDTEQLNKKDSSNPVYYVNYAHARVRSIFRKLEVDENDIIDVKMEHLNFNEKEMVFSAMLLPEILKDAFESRNVNLVTDYLYKLATNIHRFYTENKVAGSEKEKELLKILSFSILSLRTGLNILGITAKESM